MREAKEAADRRAEARRKYVRELAITVSLAAAFCFTVVMGVASFTAGGPCTAPSVHVVRTFEDRVNGYAVVALSVECSTYSTQPPNSIDNLGMKVVWSAWEGNRTLAVDQSSALGVVSGHGQRYVVGTTLGVQLIGPGESLANVTVRVVATVPTYVGDYFSPPTVQALSGPQTPGPQLDPGPQFWYNCYGPWLGAAAWWLLTASALSPRLRASAGPACAGCALALLAAYLGATGAL